MLKILLVDDHQLLLDGMQYVFRELDKQIKLFTTENNKKAFETIRQHDDLDLMVLDLNLDKSNGIDLLIKLKRNKIIVPCVILSATENLHQIRQAIDLGAMGFIPKSFSAEQLLAALKLVLAGHVFLPDQYKNLLEKGNPLSDTLNLSHRQLEVIRHMSQGKSNRQIAEALFVAETTIKSHITVILRALEVSNRHECIQKAKSIGLV